MTMTTRHAGARVVRLRRPVDLIDQRWPRSAPQRSADSFVKLKLQRLAQSLYPGKRAVALKHCGSCG